MKYIVLIYAPFHNVLFIETEKNLRELTVSQMIELLEIKHSTHISYDVLIVDEISFEKL